MQSRLAGAVLSLLAVASVSATSTVIAQEKLTFIAVALDDTRVADEKLMQYLGRQADVQFSTGEANESYEAVIKALANWNSEEQGPFLARATPYVLAVAEMLGAKVEVLATYVSRATQQTTYHSYFVVNADRFPKEPHLDDLLSTLGGEEQAARFIYHSTFSTSSYFLPSLFFRQERIFCMDASVGVDERKAIDCEMTDTGSSTKLVEAVAANDRLFAAVWDGTKSKFGPGGSRESLGPLVRFIQLPTTLPNDLLIVPSSLDEGAQERIKLAIRKMRSDEIDEDDFLTWVELTDRVALPAFSALADLRRLARERSAPVTVDITSAGAGERYLEAARQAVRLSGSEFELHDRLTHRPKPDVTWRLKEIHDGALELVSEIDRSGPIEPQRFVVSFKGFDDLEDLTRRLENLIHSRLHRIRYVWPYERESPTIIRDIGFAVREGSTVVVNRIEWEDPQRARFTYAEATRTDAAESPGYFEVGVERSDFHKFQLDAEAFAEGDPNAVFDPLSPSSYRVILERPSEERTLFKVLTIAWVVLFGVAAIAAAIDFYGYRRRSSPDLPVEESPLVSRVSAPAK